MAFYIGHSMAAQYSGVGDAKTLFDPTSASGSSVERYVAALGWLCYRLGRFDEAVQWLTRADPAIGDAVTRDRLGDALWRSGRKGDATCVWALVAAEAEAAGGNSLEHPLPLISQVKAKLAAVKNGGEPALAPTADERP